VFRTRKANRACDNTRKPSLESWEKLNGGLKLTPLQWLRCAAARSWAQVCHILNLSKGPAQRTVQGSSTLEIGSEIVA